MPEYRTAGPHCPGAVASCGSVCFAVVYFTWGPHSLRDGSEEGAGVLGSLGKVGQMILPSLPLSLHSPVL